MQPLPTHYAKLLDDTVVGRGGRGTLTRAKFAFDAQEQNTFTFDVYRLRASAAVIPIDDDNNVYLLNEFSPGIGTWQLTLARGGIDKGETPVICAARELKEEMGLSARDLTPLWAGYPAASMSDWHISIFAGHGLTAVKQEGGDEVYATNVVKMPLSEAVKMIQNGEITNAIAALAILLLNQKT